MNNELWVPSDNCDHPSDQLVGEWNSDGETVALAVLCKKCGGAWDEETVPLDVVHKTYERVISRRNTMRLD